MEEYANKFLELLRYVRYIWDDKVKIQHFLSGLPQPYKDRSEFDEPRTLEEAIRKAKYCYDHNKSKPNIHKALKDKKMRSLTKGRKVSNLLTFEISKGSHHKLWLSQPEWWEKIQETQKRLENHSNVGDVEKTICTKTVRWRMGMLLTIISTVTLSICCSVIGVGFCFDWL